MAQRSIAQSLSWLVLLAGALLAFVAAVVPHFDAGYYLMFDVLLVGLLPYLVYAMLLPYLQGWPLALPGVVIVLVHGATVIRQRYMGFDSYSDGAIYYVPVALSLFALALLVWALRTHPPGQD